MGIARVESDEIREDFDLISRQEELARALGSPSSLHVVRHCVWPPLFSLLFVRAFSRPFNLFLFFLGYMCCLGAPLQFNFVRSCAIRNWSRGIVSFGGI